MRCQPPVRVLVRASPLPPARQHPEPLMLPSIPGGRPNAQRTRGAFAGESRGTHPQCQWRQCAAGRDWPHGLAALAHSCGRTGLQKGWITEPNCSRTRQAGRARDLAPHPCPRLAEAGFADAGRLVCLRRLLHDGGCGQIGPLGLGGGSPLCPLRSHHLQNEAILASSVGPAT